MEAKRRTEFATAYPLYSAICLWNRNFGPFFLAFNGCHKVQRIIVTGLNNSFKVAISSSLERLAAKNFEKGCFKLFCGFQVTGSEFLQWFLDGILIIKLPAGLFPKKGSKSIFFEKGCFKLFQAGVSNSFEGKNVVNLVEIRSNFFSNVAFKRFLAGCIQFCCQKWRKALSFGEPLLCKVVFGSLLDCRQIQIRL